MEIGVGVHWGFGCWRGGGLMAVGMDERAASREWDGFEDMC